MKQEPQSARTGIPRLQAGEDVKVDLTVGYASRNFSVVQKKVQWHAVAHQRILLQAHALGQYGKFPSYVSTSYVVKDGVIRICRKGQEELYPLTSVVVPHLAMRESDVHAVQEATSNGQVVVTDLDDDYWAVPDHNLASDLYGKDTQDLINRILAASTGVTVSTQALFDKVDHPHKKLIRNTVRLESYQRRPVYMDASRPLQVGYVGAVGFHHDDLLQLEPWLDDWLTEHSARLIHLGYQEKPTELFEMLGISEGNRGDTMPLTQVTQFPQALFRSGVDVGLIPLLMNAFNEAKSNLQGINYAASGIPFLACPTGEYRRFAQGVVAPMSDWPAQLSRFTDPAFRKKLSNKAYGRVKQNDLRKQYPQYVDFYRSLLNGH